MPSSFTHLHTHTEFSMLDGAARVDALVAKAAADGMPALGITDHGNMYGVLDFYKACKKGGINPIIGTEAYMALESRHERPVRRGKMDDTGGNADGGAKLYYHLTLLAESTQGYRNLLKLSSRAYLEGYYYKPRVDWELLEEHHEGLIATTGCLGGVVLQALLNDDFDEAVRRAARLQDIFGRDNLFVELQDHGLVEQKRTNPLLVDLARKIDAPLLATNDSHYTDEADHVAHDVLLCVQTGALLSDPNRFKFDGHEHYLKTAAEMRHLFQELPEACDNTLWIAERAKVELELGKPSLPEFPVPEEFTGEVYEQRAAKYLRHLTYEGAHRRYGDVLPEEVTSRIDFELGVISDMGFAAYFLVVWDLIEFAKRAKIRVGPGRGSAAGCCVAYCLGIVDIDPIRYDLLFERFLNPGRKEMPDIDMDFDERFRGQMIKYAAERYGADHVAQIITFSTMGARAAVRDGARVLGFSPQDGDRVAKAMPPIVMGRATPLQACLEPDPDHMDGYNASSELRAMYANDPVARQIIDVAKGLEGLRRQDGIHAAAVVITNEALTEYLPIQRKPDSSGNPENSPIVTQYEMHGVAELGLLKMDFLGLRNLSVIERTLDLIEEETGERPDIDHVPLDDQKVYEMLKRGDSIGVFQLESSPMRALIRALAPTSFDDVAALIALYRPGPMSTNMHYDYADRKNGRKQITYLHPDLELILGGNQGLMIYQESMMRVAQKFAGYTLQEADNLRKACGKKDRALLASHREKFIQGTESEGYGAEIGNQLFDIIEPFADYAFNKSHSYGYGFVTYQTAWLKANYPIEYFAALLTSVRDSKDKTAIYLAECRSLGIEVLCPDINRSVADFAPARDANGVKEQAIVFGMAAIRNVGENLVEKIVGERKAGGPFTSIYDFCRRVDPIVLNRRAMESLIKAGAFDALGLPRQGLALVIDDLVERTLNVRRDLDVGIVSLFAAAAEEHGQDADEAKWEGTAIPIPEKEFDKTTKLRFEKEMLGLYVSDHPLRGLEGALRRHTEVSLGDLIDFASDPALPSDAAIVKVVGGVVTNLDRRFTKRGELMCSFVLEDLNASMEAMCFPKMMAEFGAMLEDDAICVIKARVDRREDVPKLIVMHVERPAMEGQGDRIMKIAVPLSRMTADVMQALKSILVEHPGTVPVQLHIGEQVVQLPPEFNVEANSVVGELRTLVGPDALVS